MVKETRMARVDETVIERTIYFLSGQKIWRSQFVTSNADRMGLRHASMAFMEQGTAMRSGLLNSDPTVRRNLNRLPSDFMFVLDNQDVTILRSQIVTSKLWGGERYSPMAFTGQFRAVFEALDTLMAPPEPERKPIGFGRA